MTTAQLEMLKGILESHKFPNHGIERELIESLRLDISRRFFTNRRSAIPMSLRDFVASRYDAMMKNHYEWVNALVQAAGVDSTTPAVSNTEKGDSPTST